MQLKVWCISNLLSEYTISEFQNVEILQFMFYAPFILESPYEVCTYFLLTASYE